MSTEANSIIIILYRMLIHYILFQNNPGQVNFWVCVLYSVNSKAHTMSVRIFDVPYTNKFCAVNIFWNITCRQAISLVAKFYHVLRRGFMIQLVILILIKCLSANQNQLFYMKVYTSNISRYLTPTTSQAYQYTCISLPFAAGGIMIS